MHRVFICLNLLVSFVLRPVYIGLFLDGDMLTSSKLLIGFYKFSSQSISKLRVKKSIIPTSTRSLTIDLNKPRTMTVFKYPEVPRDELFVDKTLDIEVRDPYRDLENTDAEVTKKFVEQQNVVTESFLEQCPHRAQIKQILTENQDFVKIGCPFKRGKKYYFFKNTGLQPQSVLYQQDTLDSEPEVFFDPNTLSEDGTTALSIAAFSKDGAYCALGLSHKGSDWIEIIVRDVVAKKNLPDRITKAKFTNVAWTHDNRGFFYARFPTREDGSGGIETETNENQRVFYHKLSTQESDDELKISFPEHPKWMIGFEVSEDGKLLHVYPKEGCQDNSWFYSELSQCKDGEKLVLKPIYDKIEAEFEYIANNGDIVFFRTNLDAKNYRVVKLDIKDPSTDNWIDVIPNHPTDVLDMAEIFSVDGRDYILLNYVRKVVNHLELHDLDGKLVKKFDTPPGTIHKTGGRREDREIFYLFTSFLTPGQTYRFDLEKPESDPTLLRESRPNNFNPDEYEIEQVFYKSKDGTEVPMFLVHRKDLIKDGENPCILYGYGGFNIQVNPVFSINRILWLNNFRGVFAVANIRGGGELGKDWHESGRLFKKQNVFNDFIAAGEFLIKNNYTNPERLAIEGGSNGGLLVAAVSNQRPDLFGATLCHVGVLDMTRYSEFTIGHAWIPEYGDPKDKKHLENLLSYSPYHNIPDVNCYPATLLLTADHDDRVVPSHSLKFIAQLQYKLGSKLPVTPLIIRIDTKSGHGGGKPITKVIDQTADVYSFLYNVLHLEKIFRRN